MSGTSCIRAVSQGARSAEVLDTGRIGTMFSYVSPVMCLSSLGHLHLLQMSMIWFSESFIAAIFKMPILACFLTLILETS
jgi:hypothetical protein